MSKRPKKTERENQKMQTSPPRKSRTPLYLAAAGALVVAAGYAAFHGEKPIQKPVTSYEQPVSIPFESTVTYFHLQPDWKGKTAGSILLHPERSRAALPSEMEIFLRGFMSAFEKDPDISGDSALQKVIAENNGNIPLMLDSVRCAIALKLMKDAPPADFLAKNRDLITYFVRFIDEPSLMDVPVIVPQQRADISASGHHLYLVDQIFDFVQTDKFYVQRSAYIPPVASFNRASGGFLDVEIKDKVLVPRHIYVSYSSRQQVVDGYHQGFISEVGHLAFNRRTQALVKKAFDTGTYSQKAFDDLMHEEEVFQHALETVVFDVFFKQRGVAVPEGHFEGEYAGMADLPNYKGIDVMRRRLVCVQKSGESLEQYVGRQRERVLEAKQRYFSADRTMFDFLHGQ